ncbi:MAG: hypothetical protein KAR54_02370 [Candidatus Pacebacteria bacterium]|nr:hypothetical protein [Candidatus Paceibacterota bacterium]
MSNQEMEKQADLARALARANNERNRFVEQFVDFDTFAEVWQHVGNNREEYDKLVNKASDALNEIKEKVSDKKALVEYLKSISESELAERMSKIFKYLK